MGPVDELPPVKRAEAAQSCAFFAGAGAKLFVGSGYNFLLKKTVVKWWPASSSSWVRWRVRDEERGNGGWPLHLGSSGGSGMKREGMEAGPFILGQVEGPG